VPTMTMLGSCCSTAALARGRDRRADILLQGHGQRRRGTGEVDDDELATDLPRMRSRPLCGPPDQGGRRTVEQTTTLIRAMDKHRRDDRPGRSHPNKGCVHWTVDGSSNETLTGVSAGQSVCGSPPPESNRRPILTIDARAVHDAMRYLISLHNRAGEHRCGGLHREAA